MLKFQTGIGYQILLFGSSQVGHTAMCRITQHPTPAQHLGLKRHFESTATCPKGKHNDPSPPMTPGLEPSALTIRPTPLQQRVLWLKTITIENFDPIWGSGLKEQLLLAVAAAVVARLVALVAASNNDIFDIFDAVERTVKVSEHKKLYELQNNCLTVCWWVDGRNYYWKDLCMPDKFGNLFWGGGDYYKNFTVLSRLMRNHTYNAMYMWQN